MNEDAFEIVDKVTYITLTKTGKKHSRFNTLLLKAMYEHYMKGLTQTGSKI